MRSDGIEVIGFAKNVIVACYRAIPNFLGVLYIGKFKSKESREIDLTWRKDLLSVDLMYLK